MYGLFACPLLAQSGQSDRPAFVRYWSNSVQRRGTLGGKEISLAGVARRRLQCIHKSSGTSTTDHLGEAWLISLAANDTVGARAAMTVCSAIIAGCVLRKLAADIGADSFDLLNGMFVHRDFVGQSRTTDVANQDEGAVRLRIQLCALWPQGQSFSVWLVWPAKIRYSLCSHFLPLEGDVAPHE
jgi:hypothetical protein